MPPVTQCLFRRGVTWEFRRASRRVAVHGCSTPPGNTSGSTTTSHHQELGGAPGTGHVCVAVVHARATAVGVVVDLGTGERRTLVCGWLIRATAVRVLQEVAPALEVNHVAALRSIVDSMADCMGPPSFD